MKQKLILTLCVCLACVCLMCACSKDGIPSGYQRASEPETDGFHLYIPKEWSYNRSSGVLTAYVSSLNTANLTVAYLETSETTMADYWQQAEAQLREDFDDYTLIDGYPTETTVDGHIAYVYEYTGTYIGITYRFRQYLILLDVNGKDLTEGICCITYTGAEGTSEVTGNADFSDNLETVEEIVSYFTFTDTRSAATADLAVTDDRDAPDGMKRANQFAYLGMDIYVPASWTVNLSDGFVGAVSEDGEATVGISEIDLTGTAAGSGNTLTERMEHYGITSYSEEGFTLIDYWNLLKAEYGDYYADGTFEVLTEPVWEDAEGVSKTTPSVSGESTYYRFSFMGTKYGVQYEVTLFVFRETSDRNNVFRIMTYTTRAGAHETHLAEAERILAEVHY